MFLYPSNYREVIIRPVIVAAAYGSGDVIGTGGAIQLRNVSAADERPSQLVKVTVIDRAAQNAVLNIYLFNRQPLTGTMTDNAAYAPSDADLDYDYLKGLGFIGHLQVAAGTAFAAASVQTKLMDPPLPFKTPAGAQRSLWAIIASGGTPTYAAATDLVIKFLFEHKI